MKKGVLLMVILAVHGLTNLCMAQSAGDFRTRASGNWNQVACWQRYDGSSWVNATWTPTYSDGAIEVLSGHVITVTVNVSVDQTTLNGTLTINSGITFQVRDGSGVDLTVNGLLINIGTIDPYSGPLMLYNNGSKYQHAQNGGTIRDASWYAGSTCEITGVTTDEPSNLDQYFAHFTWNCTEQTASVDMNGQLENISGNFTVTSTGSGGMGISQTAGTTLSIGGNYSQTGGYFYLTRGGASNTVNISGSFSLSGGGISNPASGNCTMNVSGDFNFSSGAIARPGTGTFTLRFNKSGIQNFYRGVSANFSDAINIFVSSGTTLDMGSSTITGSTGTFTLESGAGLKTMDAGGITSSGASGCIQVTGTRSYHSNANYFYYRNGAQNTGTGLPSSLSGLLTVGSSSNATNLAITNGTQTINNKLILVSSNTTNSSLTSGTIQYGSSGTLEYFGYSAQTAADREFPASSGPYSLIINNTFGVNLHANRGLNGVLTLTNGQLIIGNRTLTLNGTVTRSAGGLTGSPTSNIIYGGSGASTILPGVELGELTINRPAGTTITLAGNVTIQGTFYMTNGSFALGSYSLTYGSAASLRYNGSVSQTTSSNEFPSTGGPQNLIIANNSGVSLHAGRTIPQTLNLDLGNFSIGNNNTLTLNGTIIDGPGTLVGGSLSHIIFGGTGVSTALPSVQLGNLTIDRSAGITLGGSVTTSGTMYLIQGTLSIGFNTLTINGSINQTSGTLVGGINSDIVFGGTGASTQLPEIELRNLTINRSSGITMGGNVTVHGSLILQSGACSIGNNLLTINGSINTTSGSLTGGGQSMMRFGGLVPSTNLPAVILRILEIDRLNGIEMGGNVQVEESLNLISGPFSIQSYTLTINGDINYTGGSLNGGTTSSLVIGGGGGIGNCSLDAMTLSNLTLNRNAGIDLLNDISVINNFYLISGQINRYGYSLYGPNATLNYLGTSLQTTSSEEWPNSGGPYNVSINNPMGVDLHDDRTISGMLSLNNGPFSIGSHTFTIYGNISQFFGNLIGGLTSNLEIRGSADISSAMIPAVTLNNLLIDRSTGAFLGGDVSVFRQLSLINGTFRVETWTMNLFGLPITGTPTNMVTRHTSTLRFGGNATGVLFLPSVNQLNGLYIENPNGVELQGSIQINSILHIDGTIDLNDYEFIGTGALTILSTSKLLVGHPNGVGGNIQLSGPQNISQEVDYTFDGTTAQVSNMLPTHAGHICRHFNVLNNSGNDLTLTEPLLEVTGTCTVFPDAKLVIDPSVTFQVNGPFILKQ